MKTIFSQIRIHQWAKNILVWVPIVAAHKLTERATLGAALLSFLAFGLVASSGYVLNDILDLDADRKHPTKKDRPLASGRLSMRTAYVLVVALFLAGLIVALCLPQSFLLVLVGYYGSSVLYSAWFRRIALIDVFVLAGLYTLRIFAGSTATGIPVSEWLLAFSMFFFLSLALAKRFAELQLLAQKGAVSASTRGYSNVDLDYIPIMGITSGFLTSLVMALYVSSDHVRSLYQRPVYLWLICPLILYWISRVWLFCHRGSMEEDPVVFALKDRTSFFLLAVAFVLMTLAA
jgi:4-hydroxybenzoate polyprenyltransferase